MSPNPPRQPEFLPRLQINAKNGTLKGVASRVKKPALNSFEEQAQDTGREVIFTLTAEIGAQITTLTGMARRVPVVFEKGDGTREKHHFDSMTIKDPEMNASIRAKVKAWVTQVLDQIHSPQAPSATLPQAPTSLEAC